MVDVFTFGLTNDIELSSSSSITFFFSPADDASLYTLLKSVSLVVFVVAWLVGGTYPSDIDLITGFICSEGRCSGKSLLLVPTRLDSAAFLLPTTT